MTFFDKYGVEFSDDLKTLVRCPEELEGEYTIPNKVNVIGYGAFEECEKLTSIVIPDSVTSIEDEAFLNCSALTNIIISNGVKNIGYQAFAGCSALTSIIIPKSVTDIDECAFSYCQSLTSIVVENGNPNYDSRCNCNAIIETFSDTLLVSCKNTIIPNSVTRIGNCAFYGRNDLTNIVIPDNVTCIGDNAFGWCMELAHVVIPKSVTEIGDYAFELCESITHLTISKNVENIGRSAFYRCNGLISILVEDGNPNYDSRDNCNAIIETSSNTLITGCRNTIIPNTVAKIGEYAFVGCRDLINITIPKSLHSIERAGFSSCKDLERVVIPTGVKNIGDFAFDGCAVLKSITFNSKIPPKIQKTSFNRVDKTNCTIFVPEKSISKYKSLEGLSNFKNIFKIFDWTKKEEEILQRMYRNGFSYSDIAKALGCRKQEVLNHLEKLGHALSTQQY